MRRIFAEVQKLAGLAAEAAAGTNEQAASVAASTKARPADVPAKAESKTGSKKQILLGLISRINGASLEELTAALAWQKHSVRGFITIFGQGRPSLFRQSHRGGNARIQLCELLANLLQGCGSIHWLSLDARRFLLRRGH